MRRFYFFNLEKLLRNFDWQKQKRAKRVLYRGDILGIWKSIKGWFGEKRSKSDTTVFGNFKKWFSPHNIFAKRGAHVLSNNEMIFAAITKLSNAMSSLPLKLYKDFAHQRDHPLDYLLSVAPNGNTTAFDFIQTMEVLRNTYGNAYAIKKYGAGMEIESLYILDPTRVEPAIDEKSQELYYKITAPTGTYYVHNYEIIHVKHISTSVKGISPIDVLRDSISFDSNIRRISVEQMDNAIKASYALKIGANISSEKKAEYKKDFEDFYSKNGGVIILETGFGLDRLNPEFIDTKLFDAEKVTMSRIALVFGLPPYKFGAESRAGNEEQSIGFVQDVILPTARQYELEFNRKLLTREEHKAGYGFKFNIAGLLRADTRTRGDFYTKGIRAGFLTPNEVRELEEKPPIAGGECLLASKDLQLISDVGKSTEGGKKIDTKQ